jgi:hypothetical protein
MTNQEMLQVGNTIKSQIHPTVLMCAAARNFGVYENKEGLFGLQFNISNTSKIKYGTVRITLNGSDLYDIEITSRTKKVIVSCNDVYCDQLNEVLEGMWENKETIEKLIAAKDEQIVLLKSILEKKRRMANLSR